MISLLSYDKRDIRETLSISFQVCKDWRVLV